MRDIIEKHQEKMMFLFFIGYIFIVNYMQIFSHHKVNYLYTVFSLMNILMVFYFLIILNKNERMVIPRIRWLEFLFLLMVLSIDISKIYNREFNFIIIIFIIFGKLIPTYSNENTYKKIIYINLIGIFPFFLNAIYSYYKYTPYYNNSMGILLSINSYFIISMLFTNLENQNKKKAIILFIYLLLNIVLVYYTGSRTALLATILMVFYFFYYLIKTMKTEEIVTVLLAIAGIFYLTRKIIISVLNTLFIKWEGNGLDFSFTGRTGIWAYTLKNYEIFGGGANFFMKDLNVFHGHNILFNMLGFYGVVPFILMLFIIVYGLYLFKKIDNLNFRLFFILFIVINTFEGIIGASEYSYFQLLFFLHFGFLIKNSNYLNTT